MASRDDKRRSRRLRDLHQQAHNVARRRREHTRAPLHAIAYFKRGIARRFAHFRTAGASALAAFLAVLGPGLLAGLSDDDPAGITTYSVLGADHGYRLLWIIPASTALLVYFHLLAVRIGAASGKGFVGLIRERWGAHWGYTAVIGLLFANFGTICAEYGGHRGRRIPHQHPFVDKRAPVGRVDFCCRGVGIFSSRGGGTAGAIVNSGAVHHRWRPGETRLDHGIAQLHCAAHTP